jgi:GTPase SAR1 family protein
MSSSQPDYNFKILLLGSAAVGKTSLVQRFVHATLKDIKKWDKEFIDNCGSKVVKILVGNKEDLQKEKAISVSECEAMNKKIKSKIQFNTSALSGKHVDEAFSKIAELLVEQAKEMD